MFTGVGPGLLVFCGDCRTSFSVVLDFVGFGEYVCRFAPCTEQQARIQASLSSDECTEQRWSAMIRLLCVAFFPKALVLSEHLYF